MKIQQKKYSQKAKLSALRLLEKNDFNYLKTAKLTGVNRSTLKKWEAQYGAEVFSGISPTEQALQEVDAEMKINDRKIIRKYYNIRNQLLDRIQELISHENKLEPLVKALMSISRDLGLIEELEKKEQPESVHSSFLEIYNMQVKAMGKADLSPHEEDYNEYESNQDK
jgi:transcriptional regulator with XRE-family HTH domain